MGLRSSDSVLNETQSPDKHLESHCCLIGPGRFHICLQDGHTPVLPNFYRDLELTHLGHYRSQSVGHEHACKSPSMAED